MSLASLRRPQSSASLPALLTVGEAARLLGTGRSTLYAAIRSGHSSVPVIRVARQWRVPLAAVERILDGRDVSGVRTGVHDEVHGGASPPGVCACCRALAPSSKSPTWSDALRSSSPTASV
jgi:excisionase family DNA binding protein